MADAYAEIPVLPEDVPVTMPELPPGLLITTADQFKAFGDPTRERILSILQQRPATAKQLAATLGIAPGTAGHHLQTLEAAGLAKVVARRIVRGIVAKYYTRTARMFNFQQPDPAVNYSPTAGFLEHALLELRDAEAAHPQEDIGTGGFPHARISKERAELFVERLQQLVNDFIDEPHDPDGIVVGLCAVIFRAPPYLQADSGDLAPRRDSETTP